MNKGWWPVRKVMKHLSYSKDTVYSLVRRGELQAIKGIQGLRISQESIEAFIDRHRVKSEKKNF